MNRLATRAAQQAGNPCSGHTCRQWGQQRRRQQVAAGHAGRSAASASAMSRRNVARKAIAETHLKLGVQVVASLLDDLGSEAVGLDVGHHLKIKRHGSCFYLTLSGALRQAGM